MHQENDPRQMRGESGDLRLRSTGVQAKTNDWTIVSLGGTNIETTNNALPGEGRYRSRAGSPDSQRLSRASTHRYTNRKDRGGSIQDKPMVHQTTIKGGAVWARQIGVALA
ncbi:hypothetical protein PspLS_07230 [Pyricularia sp. CBS 133598]|nr:hypothetical protein PspLS_07230 [Pyricularia sp. CBS 133598]